jgi:hypothetical protein
MEEYCNGLGRDNWVCHALCSDTAVELVADNGLVGAPVLPYLQGSRSRDNQKAFLPQLSWQCAACTMLG